MAICSACITAGAICTAVMVSFPGSMWTWNGDDPLSDLRLTGDSGFTCNACSKHYDQSHSFLEMIRANLRSQRRMDCDDAHFKDKFYKFFYGTFFNMFFPMCGRPTYQERWNQRMRICKKRAMPGKFEPLCHQYGRNISNSYECRRYQLPVGSRRCLFNRDRYYRPQSALAHIWKSDRIEWQNQFQHLLQKNPLAE